MNGTNLEFSSVVGYLPGSNDANTEAAESPLLEAVTRKRQLKSVTY
jgi:hypothetical protein